MTPIPPNVAALIEEHDNLHGVSAPEQVWRLLADMKDALEAAYTTPARSLPTVEESAEMLNVHAIPMLMDEWGDGWFVQSGLLNDFSLALLARKGEAGE